MKAQPHILNLRHLLAAGVALAACTGFVVAAAEAPPQDTPAALQRLQEQLDQQTKRIDRLYRALGPHLEEMEERAAAMKKQQEEEAAFAMKPVFRAEDENFNAKLLFLPASRRLALAREDRTIRLLALPEGKGFCPCLPLPPLIKSHGVGGIWAPISRRTPQAGSAPPFPPALPARPLTGVFPTSYGYYNFLWVFE